MELKDKICIITGGASGIGKATVFRFVEEGAKVVFCDINPELGASVQKEIEASGYAGESCFFHCDVSRPKDAAALADFVKNQYGNCEVLFNNAGIHRTGKLHETSLDDWDKVMNVDVRGVYLVSHNIIPQMLEKRAGAIINMSSISGLFGDTDMVAYNTAKGAVTNMTRCMALDYASDGIRVNAVCPGIIRTEIVAHTFACIPDAEAKFTDALPVHYIPEPVQVANAVVFLASGRCDFMTGSMLTIDGGITAHTGQPRMGTY